MPINNVQTQGSGLVIGTGEADNTVLKNATISNSNIGHIGEKVEVKDGGTVMTAEAVAAKEAIRQAKQQDFQEQASNFAKRAFIPGYSVADDVKQAGKFVGQTMNKITGCEETSEFNASKHKHLDDALNRLSQKMPAEKSNDDKALTM